MENHEIFRKREIKTWKYFSIVLRNIGYLKWNKNHTRTHVKHQIFSGAHPPNCTMNFTRRKVNNITEEGSETEVWGHVDESGYAILRVGEGIKRIFWQARGNRPPDYEYLWKSRWCYKVFSKKSRSSEGTSGTFTKELSFRKNPFCNYKVCMYKGFPYDLLRTENTCLENLP